MVSLAAQFPAADELDVPRKISDTRSTRLRSRLCTKTYRVPDVDGTLEVTDIASMQLARITAGAHRVSHADASVTGRSLHIAFQIWGQSLFEQHERSVRLAPGHWCLLYSDQSYTVCSPGPQQRIALLMPRESLPAAIDLTGVMLRAVSGMVGANRAFYSYVAALADETRAVAIGHSYPLAEITTKLFSLALQEALDRERPAPAWSSPRVSLQTRIDAYIREHLRDPALSVDSIAMALGEPRWALYRAFGSTAINKTIWSQRLEFSRRDLLDPTLLHRTITDVAHFWGFKEYTHFSHAFRRAYGESPTTVRKRVAHPNPPQVESTDPPADA